jgi:hypothetical protein
MMHDGSRGIDRRSILSAGAILASSALLIGAPPHASADDIRGAAIYAYRSGGLPSLRPITLLTTRYEGYVESPKSYSKSQIPISFEFPSDWLQVRVVFKLKSPLLIRRN